LRSNFWKTCRGCFQNLWHYQPSRPWRIRIWSENRNQK